MLNSQAILIYAAQHATACCEDNYQLLSVAIARHHANCAVELMLIHLHHNEAYLDLQAPGNAVSLAIEFMVR
jgi:hypothetical protein